MDLETSSILPLTKDKGSNNLKNIIIKCEKYFPFFTFKKFLNCCLMQHINTIVENKTVGYVL